MKTKAAIFAMLLAISLFGCGKQPEPRHIVVLIDTSGSIDRKALAQAFKAIDEMVSRLHRGDQIAIIPILGDAEGEASGRIMRFQVPPNRQPYDSDLRGFRAKLKASLGEMEAVAVARPGDKTDILGSVLLAEQEFEAATGQSRRHLLILSDFIQEDGDMDFRRDKRLANQMAAQAFAKERSNIINFSLQHADVFLGLLKSKEYTALDRKRRNAIKEFWIQYFRAAETGPKFADDGIGLLKSENYKGVS